MFAVIRMTVVEHLKHEKLYNIATLDVTYKQGGVTYIGATIVAHHNGLIELFICDLENCLGGDISGRVFAKGHHHQPKRCRTAVCDSGESRLCGLIDKNYPGRWYLSCCRKMRTGYELYGEDGAMPY